MVRWVSQLACGASPAGVSGIYKPNDITRMGRCFSLLGSLMITWQQYYLAPKYTCDSRQIASDFEARSNTVNLTGAGVTDRPYQQLCNECKCMMPKF